MLEAYGVKFRSAGGVYIIPRIGLEKVSRLNDLMEELDMGGLTICSIPKGNADIVSKNLLEDVKERIEKIGEKAESNKRKKSSLKERDKELAEVEELIKIYDELLEDETAIDELRTQLLDVQELVNSKIAGKIAGNPVEETESPKADSSPEEEDIPEEESILPKTVTEGV